MRLELLPIGFIFAMAFLTVAAMATSQTMWDMEAVSAVQHSGTKIAGLRSGS